jgi:hypothetical protein
MAIGVGLLLTGGCELADIGTEVKYVGPSQTARPFDCRMQMMFGPLPYPHQDIARATTECPDHMASEELCFDSMRREACLVGADTVYGIAETREGGVGHLNATFARILPGPIDKTISGAPAELAREHPICSPGFAFEMGTCLPQCNPKCAADEICTRQRLCAPTGRMSKDSRMEERRQIATVISWDHGNAKHEAGNDVEADVAGEAGPRAAFASGDQGICRAVPGGDISNVRSDLQPAPAGVDPAQTAPEDGAADGALRGTLGAHVHRAVRLHPAAPNAPEDGND